MKKILYLMLGAATLFLVSCQKIDNWGEPSARFYGNVIDSYTGKNLLSSQNDWSIRIWEKSWTGTAAPQNQSLSVKQDGSYNNMKLFGGKYDMLPYGGPFWPADTVKSVILGTSTQQDFTVKPYLQILNFTQTLGGTALAPTLTLTCQLKAPIITGLPQLYEVKPFLSLTTFCGNSNNINISEYTTSQSSTSTTPSARRTINRTWAAELTAQGVLGTSDTSGTYTMGPLPVKPGYTYYVRCGAAVNDANKRYNYSEIVKIVVP